MTSSPARPGLDARSIPCADLRDRTSAGQEPAPGPRATKRFHTKQAASVPQRLELRIHNTPRAGSPRRVRSRRTRRALQAGLPARKPREIPARKPCTTCRARGPWPLAEQGARGPRVCRAPQTGLQGQLRCPVPRTGQGRCPVPRTGQGRCPARAKGGARHVPRAVPSAQLPPASRRPGAARSRRPPTRPVRPRRILGPPSLERALVALACRCAA